MIFLGHAKAMDTILIFLGIKFINTDFFGLIQNCTKYSHVILSPPKLQFVIFLGIRYK